MNKNTRSACCIVFNPVFPPPDQIKMKKEDCEHIYTEPLIRAIGRSS